MATTNRYHENIINFRKQAIKNNSHNFNPYKEKCPLVGVFWGLALTAAAVVVGWSIVTAFDALLEVLI